MNPRIDRGSRYQSGPDPCAPGEMCDEQVDQCLAPPECTIDADCDDGAFCNGAESCVAGACGTGVPPCLTSEFCDEARDACLSSVLDLDIVAFRVPRRVHLRGRAAKPLVLVISNEGQVDGEAVAVVTSTNEAGLFVEQTLMVSDPPGNGRERFRIPFPSTLGAGIITHVVEVFDGDPDEDRAWGQTFVVGGNPSAVVNSNGKKQGSAQQGRAR